MTKVLTYIDLQDVYEDDDEALGAIAQTYGLTEWFAICDVLSRDDYGARVDIPEVIGDLYYDPELQTFLYSVRDERVVEDVESVVTPRELEEGEEFNPDSPPFDVEYVTVTRVEQFNRLRAASFFTGVEDEHDA